LSSKATPRCGGEERSLPLLALPHPSMLPAPPSCPPSAALTQCGAKQDIYHWCRVFPHRVSFEAGGHVVWSCIYKHKQARPHTYSCCDAACMSVWRCGDVQMPSLYSVVEGAVVSATPPTMLDTRAHAVSRLPIAHHVHGAHWSHTCSTWLHPRGTGVFD
jgi:hypothetical protein